MLLVTFYWIPKDNSFANYIFCCSLMLYCFVLGGFFLPGLFLFQEIELNWHAAIKQGGGHESSGFTPSSGHMRVGWNELLIKVWALLRRSRLTGVLINIVWQDNVFVVPWMYRCLLSALLFPHYPHRLLSSHFWPWKWHGCIILLVMQSQNILHWLYC